MAQPSTPAWTAVAKNDMLDRIFERLQRGQIVRVKLEAVSLDSTIVKAPSRRHRGADDTDLSPSSSPGVDGPPRFIWWPRMLGYVVTFSLSPGLALDAPEWRKLLNRLGPQQSNPAVLMDRADELVNETRQLSVGVWGSRPSFTPLSTRDRPMGVQQGVVQEAQPGRALVPAVEGAFAVSCTRFGKRPMCPGLARIHRK